MQVWGCDIIVDWADPQEEPDEQTMSKVSIVSHDYICMHIIRIFEYNIRMK